MARVIPIKQFAGDAAAATDAAHARLERAGFMRMMMIGEPRLSEIIAKYKELDYEVEVLPFKTEDTEDEPGEMSATVYVRKRKPSSDTDEPQ